MALGPDDHKKIESFAAAAGERTGMHVATVIVPASDRYALYPIAWGALVALIAGAVLALGWPRLPLREAFAIEAAVFVAASILLDWFPIRLRIVPRHVRHARASAMAHRAFAARILAQKHEGGGVLLFVSQSERYAEVIGDRAAHARLGHAWDAVVATLVASARNGRLAEGITAAIDELTRSAR